LPAHQDIDILSIDVEGTELEVLDGFSGHAKVMVEANTEEAREALADYMA
jgi:hypothetical protein